MKNGEYTFVVAPNDYPGKRYRGRYVYEHQLVWWRETGSVVPKGFLIHHKDENKRNNDPSNLELKSASQHTAEHNTERKLPPISAICAECSKPILRSRRQIKPKQRSGAAAIFCSQSCGAKQQNAKYREQRGVVHNRSEYHRGCRCVVCKKAHSDYCRQWAHSKKATLP